MVTWTSLSPGGVATYTCNDGYELVGESMRNCLSDGMWDNFPPICVLVTGETYHRRLILNIAQLRLLSFLLQGLFLSVLLPTL